MNITNKVKSWENNKDCFGYPKPKDTDHIYPKTHGGSNVKANLQTLSKFANKAKMDKTKGKINDKWRFAIMKQQGADGLVFGIMYIRKKEWKNDQWWEVIPTISK